MRTETWKGRRVKVSRSSNGRFVSWHWIRPYDRGKTARTTWTRREQARQMAILQSQKRIAIWGKTRDRYGNIRNSRVEIVGSGQDLFNAVILFHDGFIPRRQYSITRAEDIEFEDLERGQWIEGPEVESH